ncbi:MAG TPA: hypothetical protein VFZ20_31345, partial [Longimicrobium sp.]
MPTIVTRTVKPSGGDYTSLSQAILDLKAQYADLVALDTILRIECHAMEDTSRVDIEADWITDHDRYIHVVVPRAARHRGRWSTDAYRLRVSDPYWALSISTTGVRLEGLQVENAAGIGIAFQAGTTLDAYVDACIIRFCGAPQNRWEHRGIFSHYTGGTLRVRNCVVYGYQENVYWSSMRAGAELVFYGNTLYGAGGGNLSATSQESPVTLRLKNNLCVSAGTGSDFSLGFVTAPQTDLARNVSSDLSAPGDDAIRGAGVRLRDVQAEDFRLDRDDTAAQDTGADLRQDPAWAFATDATGAPRKDAWSVGALQYAPSRRDAAFGVRLKAALIARGRPHPLHCDNGEEEDYPYVANFSKGLEHDSVGDVVPSSYQSLLHALETRDPADFEAIDLGPGGKKLTNPQGGLAFALEGPDPQSVTQPPAPRIDSPQNSSEMGELYWMALARDVHFNDYGSNGIIQDAIQSLNTEFSDFRGPRESGAVTAQTVFRGIYPGETVGPYLSQFLLKGTSDPRLPSGQGRGTADGLITYGDLKIDQRQVT